MIIISDQGDYEFIEGTKTLKKSNHPVFQAQVELHIATKSWIGAPNAPTPLAQFLRSKQSEENIELYDRELRFYLQKYSPEEVEIAVSRASVEFISEIREDAFNV